MYKAIPSLVPVMNPFLSSLYKDQTIQFFLIAVTCICLGMLDGAHASEKPAHTALNLAEINVNDGFADLVEAVKPAVVNISVTGEIKSNISEIEKNSQQLEEFLKRFFDQFSGLYQNNNSNRNKPYVHKTTAVGSGFIIDPGGLVVTNYHVIEHAEGIEVVFDNGTKVPATIKGVDKKTDLALLEIQTERLLPYVVFGDSDEARVGDWVIAIGNPFGLGGTTTSGIISARGRDIRSGPLDDFIQIDAPINKGNSGGPLFNTQGEVIGVNSAIFSPNGGSVGIGFAIPSSMAKNVISQLQKTGTVERGYLGIYFQELDSDIAKSLGLDNNNGALVTDVIENSPAEKAGIQPGDVILEYNGKPLSTMRDITKFVALTPNNSEVNVKIWRDRKSRTFNIQIGSRSSDMAASLSSDQRHSDLGLEIENSSNIDLQKYGLTQDFSGVVIVNVNPDSEAARRGLMEGDVIKRIGNTNISNSEDARSTINQARANNQKSILMLIKRQNLSQFVVIPLTS